ncbi:cytochrome P450 monooxygenase [Penicillium malachiteum]|nr:cytochrome P450 monooxygenase [Penicillium malachiteum]
MVLLLVTIVALCWKIASLLRALHSNWTIAKQLRIPIIITPFVPKSSLWKYALPFTRLTREDWIYHEKYTIYKDYGEVFALVTPRGVEVFIANAEAARQVLT